MGKITIVCRAKSFQVLSRQLDNFKIRHNIKKYKQY